MQGNDELDGLCEYVIHIPKVCEEVSPILTVVPLQLLSYHIAIMRVRRPMFMFDFVVDRSICHLVFGT